MKADKTVNIGGFTFLLFILFFAPVLSVSSLSQSFKVVPSSGSVVHADTQYVSVDSSEVIDINEFSLAFQLDGPDIRLWRDSSVLRELARDANIKLVRFFEHRLGKPCTYWNETTKTGTWDWRDIDLLVRRIFEIGAEPLIVIGFYSWTLNRMSSTPTGMIDDPDTGLPYPKSFAAYAAEWVKHFKQVGLPVKYYEIVNEPYHYFGWDPDPTKLQNYVELFNEAARIMRQENPDILISHDASTLKKVLDYWVIHGEDLDYIDFHKYDSGGGVGLKSDSEILSLAETYYFTSTRSIYGVDDAREVWRKARGTSLPVILSESNLNSAYGDGTDPRIQKMVGAVWTALMLRTSVIKHLKHSVYFHFASSASAEQSKPTGGAGFGMVNSDNNQPWYPYYVHKMIGSNLAVGDKLVEIVSSSTDIVPLAWIHEGKLNVLLICKADKPIKVQLQGVEGELNSFKIDNTISWKTPRIQTGTIDARSLINMNGYTVILFQTSE